MKDSPKDARISMLLTLLDEAYDHKAWHGPNLRGSIRRVQADEASFRPGKGRKCIAEIVTHAAYWKYCVRRRLRGEKRGSFTLKGSNWFPAPGRLSAAEWKACVKLLDDEHEMLRESILTLAVRELDKIPKGGRVPNKMVIRGIACHDVYHAGQIQTIRRLFAGR